MHTLDQVDAASLRTDIPEFRAGDTLKVNVKVVEGTRSRVQAFQGVVIGRQGDGVRGLMVVRVRERSPRWPLIVSPVAETQPARTNGQVCHTGRTRG